METLNKIKELVEKISVDTEKALKKGNRTASIRARRNAQELKDIITPFRKEVLAEIDRLKPRKSKRKNKDENDGD